MSIDSSVCNIIVDGCRVIFQGVVMKGSDQRRKHSQLRQLATSVSAIAISCTWLASPAYAQRNTLPSVEVLFEALSDLRQSPETFYVQSPQVKLPQQAHAEHLLKRTQPLEPPVQQQVIANKLPEEVIAVTPQKPQQAAVPTMQTNSVAIAPNIQTRPATPTPPPVPSLSQRLGKVNGKDSSHFSTAGTSGDYDGSPFTALPVQPAQQPRNKIAKQTPPTSPIEVQDDVILVDSAPFSSDEEQIEHALDVTPSETNFSPLLNSEQAQWLTATPTTPPDEEIAVNEKPVTISGYVELHDESNLNNYALEEKVTESDEKESMFAFLNKLPIFNKDKKHPSSSQETEAIEQEEAFPPLPDVDTVVTFVEADASEKQIATNSKSSPTPTPVTKSPSTGVPAPTLKDKKEVELADAAPVLIVPEEPVQVILPNEVDIGLDIQAPVPSLKSPEQLADADQTQETAFHQSIPEQELEAFFEIESEQAQDAPVTTVVVESQPETPVAIDTPPVEISLADVEEENNAEPELPLTLLPLPDDEELETVQIVEAAQPFDPELETTEVLNNINPSASLDAEQELISIVPVETKTPQEEDVPEIDDIPFFGNVEDIESAPDENMALETVPDALEPNMLPPVETQDLAIIAPEISEDDLPPTLLDDQEVVDMAPAINDLDMATNQPLDLMIPPIDTPEHITKTDEPVELASFASKTTAIAETQQQEAPNKGDGAALRVVFEGNQTKISDEDKVLLAQLVQEILSKKNSKLKVVSRAEGEDGQSNSARRISLQRAITIRSYLIKSGLDSLRINVQAVGNEIDESGNANLTSIYVLDGEA